uniref:Ribosomal protein S14 n=1 Tax=Paraurostyla sp. TaxID=6014 RepID=A0A3Q8BBY7_9STIC|nr:ribosomal protein S14 [Paraurostyla sp.]
MRLEKGWKMLDYFRRKLFLKNEFKKKILKGILNNRYLPFSYRYLAFWNKSKLTRLSSSTKIQNRCVKSGRVWSVKKITRYSRFIFRIESYKGNLPGFKRASW